MRWLVVALMLIASSATAQTLYLPHKVTTVNDWSATFGPCTAGTDCYCDRVQGTGPLGTGDPIYNSTVLGCIDVDNDGFYATTPTDAGTSGRNWVDDTGLTNDRGHGSLWRTLYGNGGNPDWYSGEPASPSIGPSCGFSTCTGLREYDEADRWDGNALANGLGPCIDVIYTESGFSDEHPSSTAPVVPDSGGANWFGDAALAFMTTRGVIGSERGACGTMGSFPGISGNPGQLGVTMALTYEDNVITSGAITDGQPWKHDEVSGPASGAGEEMGLIGFRSTNYTEPPNPNGTYATPYTTFPYQGFIFDTDGAGSGWECPTARSGWTVHVGTMFCTAAGGAGSYLAWSASTYSEDATNGYDLATDMLDGEYHCFQSYWDFRDISSVEMRMVHDGKTVVHVTGIDMTGSVYDNGDGTGSFDGVILNAYSNRSNLNTGQGGSATQPAATTRKILDNYTIANGTPHACSNAGFPSGYDSAF